MIRLDRIPHGRSTDQFHGIERGAIGIATKFVNRHNSRMFQLAGDLRFFKESLNHLTVVHDLRQQLFVGNFATNSFVFRPPNVAHAAVSKVLDQSISVGCFP